MQLSTLETRLGYRLCERGHSGFRLTVRGERFADSARKLLDTLDAFSAEACKVGRTLVGALNLGLIGHALINTSARISQVIERFREHDKSVHFMVSMCPPGELEGLLFDSKIHMAIGYFWHRVPALDYTMISHEMQLTYAGCGHPLFRKAGDMTPVQASTYAWAWRSYPLPEMAGSPAERPMITVADNMEAVAMLVFLGRHLGYLPEYFAASYIAQGLLTSLTPAAVCYEVPFDTAVRRDVRRNDLLATFIADMKTAHV